MRENDVTSIVESRIRQFRRGTVPNGWEVRRLGDVATISSGGTPSRSNQQYWCGDIPWVSTGELHKRHITSTDEAISAKAVEETGLKKYPAGTLLVAMYGQGKTRGTTAMLDIDATINQACAAITITDANTSSKYLFYFLQASYEKLRRLSNVGNQENLNADIIRTYPVFLPPLEEQCKIAEILATQDKVIELYECKIEQLQIMKKICLQKMLPRHGRDAPEVRFQRFCEKWNRQRLGSLFFEHTEKRHPELPALTTMQGRGTVRRDEAERNLQYDTNNLSNYKTVQKDDFIVHLRSFEGGLEVVTTPGLISPAYHVFRGQGIDSRFYYAYFRSADFINGDLKPHVYGIRDGRSIDIEGMKTIKILHTSLKEQQKIGDYMESFDRLISLHQRRYDEEKRKKKALMQLLLTGIVRV